MVRVEKDSLVTDVKYENIVRTSYGGKFGDMKSFFTKDGIFIPIEKAKLIRDAFHKKPLECSSEEEWASIRDSVQTFCKMAGEQ